MKKELFHIPEGVIYLDGNSLGPLPKAVVKRLQQTMQDEWGEMLISAWNKAGWINLPERIGDRIGRLIGCPPGTVTVGDTLSIKVYQALAAALAIQPDRRVVLTDSGNFPTDIYMAEGLLKLLGRGHELRVVEPDALGKSITDEVAVLMATQVDYRTGRLHDMDRLTAKAQEAGAATVWDLAHSAGAFPVNMKRSNAEFAVGCTYKYLNAGPGAPAFIYVRPDLADRISPALAGWMGHESPFDFDPVYRPATGTGRLRVGTPPVLQMTALDTALDVWDGVSLDEVRKRSVALSELFISEVEKRCPQLELASPRKPEMRGSQVSFRHREGYAVMQALIAQGIIGDFRAPDIIRFGFTPLYIDESDVMKAVAVLERIMKEELWNRPEFRVRAAVT